MGGPGSIAATSVGGQLDHDRIGRLLSLFQLLSKQKHPLDLIKTALREIKNTLSFENCTFFVMQPELVRMCENLKSDLDQIYIQRSQMESGRTQMAISESGNVASPIFKTQDEVRYSIKTISQIAQPVIFKDDDMMLVIQLEARFNKRTNKTLGF